jgi:hypothetical protein
MTEAHAASLVLAAQIASSALVGLFGVIAGVSYNLKRIADALQRREPPDGR